MNLGNKHSLKSNTTRSMPALKKDYINNSLIMKTHRSKALTKLIGHLNQRKSNENILLPKVSTRYESQNVLIKTKNQSIDYRGLFILNANTRENHLHNKSSFFTKSFSNWGMFRDTSMNTATKERLKLNKRDQILNNLSNYKGNHYLERTRK